MKNCARKLATNPTTMALHVSPSGFWPGHALSICRLACLTALLAGGGMPQASPRAMATERLGEATLGADGRSLVVLGQSCQLTATADRARVSCDGKAFIVRDRGYVERAQLKACGNNPVSVRQIRLEAGRLEDVNLASGRDVALLPVSTSPLLYVALVARIGSASSLVAQPGAWQATL